LATAKKPTGTFWRQSEGN